MQQKIIWTLVGIGIVILALFVWHPWKSNSVSSEMATTTPIASSTQTEINPSQGFSTTTVLTGNTYTIPGTDIVVTLPQAQKVSAPEPVLNRPIPDTSKLDPTLVARTESNMKTAVANLQATSTTFEDWIDLGFDRKTLGDYQGAAEAWEYVSLLYPQNSISFGDLGDLYAGFLNQPSKAEIDYAQAIKNNPSGSYLYDSLFALYIQDGKSSQAVALAQNGIKANPDALDLYVLLARYYKNAGNQTQANSYYNQAITLAQKQGNTSAATSLQAEENGN